MAYTSDLETRIAKKVTTTWCLTMPIDSPAIKKAKHDSRKATEQLMGSPLLTDLDQREDGSWLGKLFIPDKNMRATAKLRLAGPQQLKVSGCAAGKALCKSALWTRTVEPLPVENGK